MEPCSRDVGCHGTTGSCQARVERAAGCDLFVYFFATRLFEAPGNGKRGRQVFLGGRCGECHGIDAPVRPGIRPVAQWDSLWDPIALGQQMWSHSHGRGAAFADFDRDGDLDVLITTNHGPAYLYRNDQTSGNRSIRFRLIGTKSNRDAIGAQARIFYGDQASSRLVKSGSSYLSQCEPALTLGLGRRDKADRAVLTWPSGRIEEYKNLAAGRLWECTEGKGVRDTGGF